MAQWVNFKAMKERVSMENIIMHYQLFETLTKKGTNLVGPCPIHKGSNKTQFHVSLIKNNYNCFGDCHGGGNVIDFVAAMEGLDKSKTQDLRKAALLLQEWFALTPLQASEENVQTQPEPAQETTAAAKDDPPEPVNPPLKFSFKYLDREHLYLRERGLMSETIEHFGVGYHAGRGIMHGRVVIPIHNERGELVAYAGRWPGDAPPEGEGKYRLPPNFRKSLVVFNLHRAREHASGGFVLVEGFFDLMRLWQTGIMHAVALMGSSMSGEQEQLITETVGPHGTLTLLFDGDAAGRSCTEDALLRLSRKVYVKVIHLPEGAQPDQLSAEEMRRLV